ncbi:MAG: site-specific DNA-methyltransferase [Candidatus Marsarchaeota archaeon]|nr:site-specific DNA-methyltransferase [Candidatus Marsarchaeota archaeon]
MSDTYKFLKQIPSNSVSLILTSPHYNVGKIYEKKQKLEDYLAYQRNVAEECVRVLKKNGSIAWEVGNYTYNGEIYPLDYFFYEIFKNKFGLRLRNRIIWKFEHGLHAQLKFSGRYETILWFTKSDNFTFNLDSVRVPQKYPGKTYYKGEKRGLPSGNPLGKNPGDVWEITLQDWENEVWDIPNVKANHVEKTVHPAQFPIELAQRVILALSNENEVVLDPYGGVGTTALASALLNRKAISIDRSEKYSNIALRRLNKLIKGRLRIRKIGTKKHIPNGKVAQVPKEWKN